MLKNCIFYLIVENKSSNHIINLKAEIKSNFLRFFFNLIYCFLQLIKISGANLRKVRIKKKGVMLVTKKGRSFF